MSDQIRQLQAEHAAMSAAQRRQLDVYAETLRHEVRRTLAAHNSARQAQARSQAAHLDSYSRELRARTQSLLAEASTARAALHADQAAAHESWLQFCGDMGRRRTGNGALVPADHAASATEKPPRAANRKRRAPAHH